MSDQPTTSRRSRESLRAGLQRWFDERLDGAVIGELEAPGTNGMSSETLLFDVTFDDDGQTTTQRCVARIPPDADDHPVFPHYDVATQFELMSLVGERTAAPVPPTLWSEPDPGYLGAPFIVMGRVDGVVPPDVMPYAFGGNWLFEATAEQQRTLQNHSVAVLAEIHRIGGDDPALAALVAEGGDRRSALRRHVDGWRAYHDWVVDLGGPSPLAAEAFEHLEATWPADVDVTAEPVLSWGDSRIGNILYDNFAPVAVLDWEMAGIAPAQVDVGWMVFMHRFFHDLATSYGLPGMPDFMRLSDVTAHYEALTGRTLGDLRWFIEYAAARHFVIMYRISSRLIAFGQAEAAADPDAAVPHASTVRAMIDGSYWSRLD